MCLSKLFSYNFDVMLIDAYSNGRAIPDKEAGVGMARKPQIFLKSGDEMSLNIDKLGSQKQKVFSYDYIKKIN